MEELFGTTKKSKGTLGHLYDRFHRTLRNRTRTVDITDMRDWAEEAQEEIAKLYGPVSQKEYPNAASRQEYDLPNDCLVVDEVKQLNGGVWSSYVLYAVTANDTIKFRENGTYVIVYRKMPSPLDADPTEDLSVHTIYHRAMVDYAVYRYYSLESGGDPVEQSYGTTFYEKFLREVNRAAEMLEDRVMRKRTVNSRDL